MRAKPGSFRFDQTDALFDLAGAAASGKIGAAEANAQLKRIQASPPSVPSALRYLGYLLLIFGLALNQRPTVIALAVTMGLGILVALILTTAGRWGKLAFAAPFVAALVTGLGISLTVQAGLVTEPAKVLIPLLASSIPGAALAVSSLELVRGAIGSGASRLTMALHQLIVLAFGVVLALAVVPAGAIAETTEPLLPWTLRPVGILLYAVGVWLAFSAPRRALPSLLVVLTGAWLVQQIALLGVASYAPSLLAGAAGVLIALGMRTKFAGAPPLLTLNPVFRIIAPGGLGLIGLTKAAAGTNVSQDIATVAFSFLAVAFGMVLAMALAESVEARREAQRSSMWI